jgi:hypothetical protein
MGKLMGFISGLLGKLILLVLAFLLAGVLYVGAYFYVKSGEPMTVAEAQRRAPGLTFRDFWASRVEQWRLSDDEQEKAGVRRSCEPVNTGVQSLRLAYTAFEVFRMRINGPEYSEKLLAGLGNSAPSLESIHQAAYTDAVWSTFEAGAWWQLSSSPGFPGGPKLNHRRVCVTTYPTPADVSANRTQETDTLP